MIETLLLAAVTFAVNPSEPMRDLQVQASARAVAEQLLKADPTAYRPEGCTSKAYGAGWYIHYATVTLAVNALGYAHQAGDTNLVARLVAKFAPYCRAGSPVMNGMRHVDMSIVGALPLELAILTGDKEAAALGLSYADRQWEAPRAGMDFGERLYDPQPIAEREENFAQGYTPETRLWIDDMYMITLLQTQAYRLTGDRKYVERAAREMCLYLEKLQREDGLFTHGPDVPFVWGRGAGWMAAGMTLNLKHLPEDSPHRAPILDGYRKMMATLLRHQRPSGLWGQLVDDPESYEETSGSAMFAYALAEGVANGWLDRATCSPAVERATTALLAQMDGHGNIRNVCVGTGKRNDRKFYLTRPACTGDPHGQAPFLWLCRALCEPCSAVPQVWPEPTAAMRPWVYNWWMASAVDAEGLERQCAELSAKGFGGFHVIPIYGANGPSNVWRSAWRGLLTPEWIEAWNLAVRTAKAHGLGIDLTMGSGWCFGGPWIDRDHAASSGMRVKRAGPGGEGYMLDPFDPEAMRIHVAQFDRWFGRNGAAERPRAFYHDSYEYYGARPKRGEDVDAAQLACFSVWTDWCRENGYLSRNEAHGAPSNWLDFYGLADIPETEMFGRRDRDVLVSKFASSAAHVKGTTLVSAEACTWIDEHFHERPGEIKRVLDRLFLAGVNHVFYHGLCYSPVGAVWPGWTFYASLEMNPRNPIWREMRALNDYVTRCQSLFQTWTPDNDLAIVWDPAGFRAKHPGETACMSVHARDWFYGEAIGRVARDLSAKGYCFDYISPRQLRAGLGAKYVEVIDPEKTATPVRARPMPFAAESGLLATRWRKNGQTGYFVVNESKEPKTIRAAKSFVAMNPLDGTVSTADEAAVDPGHSLFVVGEGFAVGSGVAVAAPRREVSLDASWRLTPVVGGPALPAPRTLKTLVDWRTFDEHFSGTIRYETKFDFHSTPTSITCTSLDLGEVREIAHVWVNGRDLGTRFMRPYGFAVPSSALKEGENELVVEVTNLGANRLRWNDLNGVEWKLFSDINMVGIDFDHGNRYVKLDAAKWDPLASGLLGPVTLR